MSLAVHPEHHHHYLRSPITRSVSSASAANSTMRASSTANLTLEDKFEIIKEVGDGSFGSVVLARVRSRGAHIARRGTMVAIKSMKKTFDTFEACLELREVVFLRTLPTHAHLVPALDVFLDPLSKKLHICMEYMDGNLYQLMKARDHKLLDTKTVKSILYQIISGLDHIHLNNFFHRDIKPENILISSSAPNESSTFSRYGGLVTPPSTPPTYAVKIADFGLARETRSKQPYTTYVSTRWYRAPEVLLRAGEYSAPVDMWAVGAMAVEIATLKPLFPGRNEVDQVWRVCEIMGSPGNWYNKSGVKIGGGEWSDGVALAHKLGFSFPRMAPHAMDSILPAPQFPSSLPAFVTWCLMWDPKNRPTATQAMSHEYFIDAVDPLRPRSSTTSRLLGRKVSEKSIRTPSTTYMPGDSLAPPSYTPSVRASWFRRSIINPATGRDSSSFSSRSNNVVEPETGAAAATAARRAPRIASTNASTNPSGSSARSTWAPSQHIPGLAGLRNMAPMSNAMAARVSEAPSGGSLKIGPSRKANGTTSNRNATYSHRQLTELHRQKAERALMGNANNSSHSSGSQLKGSSAGTPTGNSNTSGTSNSSNTLNVPQQKESFFAHLRKRARRLSGRHQTQASPVISSPTSIQTQTPRAKQRIVSSIDTSNDVEMRSPSISAKPSNQPMSPPPAYAGRSISMAHPQQYDVQGQQQQQQRHHNQQAQQRQQPQEQQLPPRLHGLGLGDLNLNLNFESNVTSPYATIRGPRRTSNPASMRVKQNTYQHNRHQQQKNQENHPGNAGDALMAMFTPPQMESDVKGSPMMVNSANASTRMRQTPTIHNPYPTPSPSGGASDPFSFHNIHV